MEMHTAEPGSFEVLTKPPGIDQILTKLIQTGGETLHSEIHENINCIWMKEELPQQQKRSIIVAVRRRVTKLAVVVTDA